MQNAGAESVFPAVSETPWLSGLLAVLLTGGIATANATGFLVAWAVFTPGTPFAAAMGGVLMAFLCFCAQFIVIVHVKHVRATWLRCRASGDFGPFRFYFSAVLIFALISAWGLENFWAVTLAARGAGALPWYDLRNLSLFLVFGGLAFAEPALFWALDALKAPANPAPEIAVKPALDASGAAQERVSRETSADVAPPSVETRLGGRRSGLHVVSAPPPTDLAAIVQIVQPEVLDPALLLERARALLSGKTPVSEVVRLTGLSKTKVYDLRNEMAAERKAG